MWRQSEQEDLGTYINCNDKVWCYVRNVSITKTITIFKKCTFTTGGLYHWLQIILVILKLIMNVTWNNSSSSWSEHFLQRER